MSNVNKRGAVQKTSVTGNSSGDFVRHLKRGLLAIGGTAGVVLGVFVFGSFDRPLTNIMISGDFKYLQKNDLTNLLREELNGGFLTVNLTSLQRLIEAHPWVDQVSIWREWPTTLHLDVTEEIPIALWGDRGFLNYRGKKLQNPNQISLTKLPVLQSNSATSEQMMRQYQSFNQQLSGTGLGIVRLEYDDLGAWQLDTTADFKLLLGRNELPQKLRRFSLVWSAILSDHSGAIGSVDLRYPNGLAVGWRNITLSAHHDSVFMQNAGDLCG